MVTDARTALVIAAHPDDEVLGCGGTIAKLSRAGADVHVAFLADGVGARTDNSAASDEDLSERRQAASRACALLGVKSTAFHDLPDNRLDSVPLLDIIKPIEALIERFQPDTIFTHCAGDVNVDHCRVHQATIVACRPQPGHPVNNVFLFEVASSTEWQLPGSAPAFVPNVFVEITDTIDIKLSALGEYKQELRAWPHPRSTEAVKHLASWRGATIGVASAEAFVLGRSLTRI